MATLLFAFPRRLPSQIPVFKRFDSALTNQDDLKLWLSSGTVPVAEDIDVSAVHVSGIKDYERRRNQFHYATALRVF